MSIVPLRMNNTTQPTGNSCLACVISASFRRIKQLPGQLARFLEHHGQSLAPLFLRVLLAYEFGEAGWEKWHGENWFADLYFPFPVNLLSVNVNWTLATGLEIIGPIALLLGFRTRLFSLALMCLTIVAIAVVHWPNEWHSLSELWQGYAISNRGYGNFKLPLMYLFMLGSLLLSGSGSVSLDAWIKRTSSSKTTET